MWNTGKVTVNVLMKGVHLLLYHIMEKIKQAGDKEIVRGKRKINMVFGRDHILV